MRYYFKCKKCGCTTSDYNAGTKRAETELCYTDYILQNGDKK